jgi:chromosome segregation ATPase
MHEEIANQLEEIFVQARNVAARHNEMADELKRLRSEKEELKKVNDELGKKVVQLEELIYILKSSISPLDEKSKKGFEKRLNHYLLTINKCIGLLKT